MKKAVVKHTSQDHDRKHQHDHASENPRVDKAMLHDEDKGDARISPQTAELIEMGHADMKEPQNHAGFTEDKRETARHEHTNHFTNRAPADKQ